MVVDIKYLVAQDGISDTRNTEDEIIRSGIPLKMMQVKYYIL